jgi:hypothetical protein
VPAQSFKTAALPVRSSPPNFPNFARINGVHKQTTVFGGLPPDDLLGLLLVVISRLPALIRPQVFVCRRVALAHIRAFIGCPLKESADL